MSKLDNNVTVEFLEGSIKAVTKHVTNLYDSAHVLMKNKRYSRVVGLCILAIEETAKCYVLKEALIYTQLGGKILLNDLIMECDVGHNQSHKSLDETLYKLNLIDEEDFNENRYLIENNVYSGTREASFYVGYNSFHSFIDPKKIFDKDTAISFLRDLNSILKINRYDNHFVLGKNKDQILKSLESKLLNFNEADIKDPSKIVQKDYIQTNQVPCPEREKNPDFDLAIQTILENARSLIDEAILLKKNHPSSISTFLLLCACEELGKLEIILKMKFSKKIEGTLNWYYFEDYFYNHVAKFIKFLSIDEGKFDTLKKRKEYADSVIDEAFAMFEIRNKCIYTNIERNFILIPNMDEVIFKITTQKFARFERDYRLFINKEFFNKFCTDENLKRIPLEDVILTNQQRSKMKNFKVQKF